MGHDVSTVAHEGWARLANGDLLRQAAVAFEVLLTADQSLEFQQNLSALPLAVIVLVAASNRLESLEPLVPTILDALNSLPAKMLLRVGT